MAASADVPTHRRGAARHGHGRALAMSVGQEVDHELPDLVRALKDGEVTRPWKGTELTARQRAGSFGSTPTTAVAAVTQAIAKRSTLSAKGLMLGLRGRSRERCIPNHISGSAPSSAGQWRVGR